MRYILPPLLLIGALAVAAYVPRGSQKQDYVYAQNRFSLQSVICNDNNFKIYILDKKKYVKYYYEVPVSGITISDIEDDIFNVIIWHKPTQAFYSEI